MLGRKIYGFIHTIFLISRVIRDRSSFMKYSGNFLYGKSNELDIWPLIAFAI
jgi:hypothetical protein